jgi:hypothetical protein
MRGENVVRKQGIRDYLSLLNNRLAQNLICIRNDSTVTGPRSAL